MTITKKLYVISDLHIGGEYPKNDTDLGFRICNKIGELTVFIKQKTEIGKSSKFDTELVINGDFIDFLAEKWDGDEPWKPFIDDPKQAAKRLQTIIDRDKILFDALADFLGAGHQLTILLGNHDIELSFPTVRQVLYENLKSYRKHLKFIYDGEAYVVGKVLIEHGNRYDGFNVIDQDNLRQLRSNDSRLEPTREKLMFKPPVGSLLVSSVMNKIKKDYAFVDLLKPETEATIPLLLALAPQYRKHLLTIMKLGVEAKLHDPSNDGQPRYSVNIAANANDGTKEFLKYLKEFNNSHKQAELFLKEIIDSVISPIEAEDNNYGTRIGAFQNQEEHERTWWAYLKLLTANKAKPLDSRLGTLKTALQVLRTDSSFERDKEPKNSNYLKAATRLLEGDNFDVVVFGHTHLPKKIELDNGIYINTGTWADVMKFPLGILDLDEPECTQALKKFVDEIKPNNEIEPNKISRYINDDDFKATYAEIDLDENGNVLEVELKDA